MFELWMLIGLIIWLFKEKKWEEDEQEEESGQQATRMSANQIDGDEPSNHFGQITHLN